MTTRAVILENEPAAMETLSQLLEQYCPTVKLVGKAYNNAEAKDLIDLHSPDLVFLDIELDSGNSLELLGHYSQPRFDIIFITAHEEYAIQAIKASCLDYLIKPIDSRDLQTAVAKHEQKLGLHHYDKRLQNMMHNVTSQQLAKVTIPTVKGYEFISISDIIFCKADGSYTLIQTTHGEPSLTSKSLGDLEFLLVNSSFFRCHKSYLINLKHVLKYDRANGQIRLTNDIAVDLAARRREEFLVRMNPQ